VRGRGLLDGRARLVALPVARDPRGALTPIAFDALPFVPARVFAVSDAPAGAVRGGHAHRSGLQALVCLQGAVLVELRVAAGAAETLELAPGGGALVFGPGVWSRQTYRAPGTVLLVLASEPYDPASYVDQPFDPA
jgi:hypothetical protein